MSPAGSPTRRRSQLLGIGLAGAILSCDAPAPFVQPSLSSSTLEVDVGVALTGPASATAGTLFTLTLTFHNGGTAPATATTTRLQTPQGFGGGSLTTGGATCSISVVDGGFLYTCEHGTLDAGASGTITLSGSTTTLGPAAFSASVTTTAADGDASNDAAATTVEIQAAVADLRTEKRILTSAPYLVDASVRYRLLVFNDGPDAVPGYTVTDDLPAGLTVTSALPVTSSVFCSGNVCTGGGGSATWSTNADGTGHVVCRHFQSIASGSVEGCDILVRPTQSGTFTNTFSVVGTGVADPNAANDAASVSLTVAAVGPTISCPADITVNNDPGQANATVNAGTPATTGTAPLAVDGIRSDGEALDAPYPIGTTTITWTVTDNEGLSDECEQTITVVDAEPPVTSVSIAPAPAPSGWHLAPVTVTLHATDNAGDAGLQIHYSIEGAGSVAATTVPGNEAAVALAAEGTSVIHFHAVDAAGNEESESTLTVRLDLAAPDVQCAAADDAWHGGDVSLSCSAADPVSGLANAADAAFELATATAAGTEDADVPTASREVCDQAGHCATAGPIGGNRIDRRAPIVTITTPTAGGLYLLNASVAANYACADGGSGVAFCTGTLPDGANLSLSVPGTQEFVVETADNVGNEAQQSVQYRVGFATSGLCRGEPGHTVLSPIRADPYVVNPGRSVPVRFRVCDAAGTSVGPTPVVAEFRRLDGGVVRSTSAHSAFRWGATDQLWIFNLDTNGLARGTYGFATVLVDGSTIEFSLQIR